MTAAVDSARRFEIAAPSRACDEPALPAQVEIDHALRDLVATGELVLGAPFGVEEAVERKPFAPDGVS
jgi:hypothetical protein